ncbi:hypothetical protein [Allorhizobium undicola]|uniref:hypothetical protein n=1 Tax=Allorhizobium undicola TaxID=78527 RepID=UPI0012B57901|nr:hypothetical protein [Allorhizobium undicola]
MDRNWRSIPQSAIFGKILILNDVYVNSRISGTGATLLPPPPVRFVTILSNGLWINGNPDRAGVSWEQFSKDKARA